MQEISDHSAGLESYTPPSESGGAGITQLTQAGLAALGLDPYTPYIETYSWGAPIAETSFVPAPPGTYTYYGFDFTPLANAIIDPVNELIAPIVRTVNSILDALNTTIKNSLVYLSSTLADLAKNAIAGINNLGKDISDQVKKITDPVTAKIEDEVSGLNEFVTGFWAQAIKNIENLLVWASLLSADIDGIISGLEDESKTVSDGFAGVRADIVAWVPDEILKALLQALDSAVT